MIYLGSARLNWFYGKTFSTMFLFDYHFLMCWFFQIDDSLEKVQADLFERHVCGGLKMNILQYAMVMFWCNYSKGISGCSCGFLYDSIFILM